MTLAMNLSTLSNIFTKDNDELLNIFMNKYESQKLKSNEMDDLHSLVKTINNHALFEGFHVGFEINQIGKEFDLLKVTDHSVLNIELKSEKDIKEIYDQQYKNSYYLEAINKEISIITYVSEDRTFYKFSNQELMEITEGEVISILEEIAEDSYMKSIHSLFKPSQFLISPFNNTEEFIESKYFLTQQQKSFSKRILKYSHPIQLIHGPPGTGKTLLLYDIIKREREDNSTLVIHCGQLNEGHNELIEDFGWNIKNAHSNWIFNENEYKEIKLVFIDEAQRFVRKQLEYVIKMSEKYGFKIIISMDPRQYLRQTEKEYKNFVYISSIISNDSNFELSKKIRTNKEIAKFTKVIFSGKNFWDTEYASVSIEYLATDANFTKYIYTLENLGWVYLPYTRSKYISGIKYQKFCSVNELQNSHRVIGQEFDNVVVILDESFSFDEEEGYIKYTGPKYYDPRQMLFQNITRARENLKIIVYNNEVLFDKLVRIITNSKN